MTATEQPTLPAWDAGRFDLAPTNYLYDVDYPITHSDPVTPCPDLLIEMTAPTVLLPISPLAGFDRLRKTVRDDLRQLHDELGRYLQSLGIVPAGELVAMPLPQKRRRWHIPGTRNGRTQS